MVKQKDQRLKRVAVSLQKSILGNGRPISHVRLLHRIDFKFKLQLDSDSLDTIY